MVFSYFRGVIEICKSHYAICLDISVLWFSNALIMRKGDSLGLFANHHIPKDFLYLSLVFMVSFLPLAFNFLFCGLFLTFEFHFEHLMTWVVYESHSVYATDFIMNLIIASERLP